MGWPPLVWRLSLVLHRCGSRAGSEEKGRMKLDVSIGILYTTTMRGHSLNRPHEKLQCGSVRAIYSHVLSVTIEELSIHWRVEHPGARLIVCFQGTILYCIRSRDGRSFRYPSATYVLSLLLLTLVALTVVVSLKTVGAILVFAMISICLNCVSTHLQPYDAHPIFHHHRVTRRSWSGDLCYWDVPSDLKSSSPPQPFSSSPCCALSKRMNVPRTLTRYLI